MPGLVRLKRTGSTVSLLFSVLFVKEKLGGAGGGGGLFESEGGGEIHKFVAPKRRAIIRRGTYSRRALNRGFTVQYKLKTNMHKATHDRLLLIYW